MESVRNGWSQVAEFAQPPHATSLSALTMRLETRGWFDGTLSLSILAVGEAVPAMKTVLHNLGPRALVVLDIGALAGQRIERIVITGKGDDLQDALAAAGIVGPLQ